MANPGNHNNGRNADLEFTKNIAGRLGREDMEALVVYLNQEIERKMRRENYDRERVENQPEFELWKKKKNARKVRHQREHAMVFVVSNAESDDEDDEGGMDHGGDVDSSSEADSYEHEMTLADAKAEEDKLYEKYLAEKSNRRVFARTMQEPLVDSDGEEIESATGGEESDENDSEEDMDGYGSACSSDGEDTDSDFDY